MTAVAARLRSTVRRRLGLPTAAGAVVLVMLLGLVSLDVGSAAFVSTTGNAGNSVSAITIQPPTNVQGTMTLNVLPLLTCKVVLNWTASTTPGVTSYEVTRVVASTGVVDAGPWTVAATTYTDNPVPLQLIGNSYEWRVKSKLGNWFSAYAVAVPDNLLACLL